MLLILSAIDMRFRRHFIVAVTILLKGAVSCDLCIRINLVKNFEGVLKHFLHLLYRLLISTIFYGMIDTCLHLVYVLLKLL